MDSWKTKIIEEKIDELKKETLKQFMIAYASLPEKYQGYLTSIPQWVKIWHEKADDNYLKELREKYDWNSVGSWSNGIYYSIDICFFGIDGEIAMFNDKAGDQGTSIRLSIVDSLPRKLIIKARAKVGSHEVEGYAEVAPVTKKIADNKTEPVLDKDGNIVYDSIEKATSNAIRKALSLFGNSKFPIHKTSYGDNPIIGKFREFMRKEKDEATDATEGSSSTEKV
jgi:hypothetical protein